MDGSQTAKVPKLCQKWRLLSSYYHESTNIRRRSRAAADIKCTVLGVNLADVFRLDLLVWCSFVNK